jgi:hypothetical protein
MAAKIVGQLRAILGLDKSKFDQGLNGAEKKANSFGSVIKKIGGILAAAFSVGAIIRFSKEAMRMAAEVEGIKNAYTKFGDEGKRVLEEIKIATRGVIEEDKLMQIAVKAKSLGIPFKDLGTYLTFATNQAIRLGKPIEEFADLMINAVGRQQARGLVAMGLAAKEANAAFTDTAGIVGFVKKKLEEMGPVADTTAIKMARLAVAGTELKQAWGAWLNKGQGIAAIRSYFTDLLMTWADESKTFGQKAAAIFKQGKPNQAGVNDPYAKWRNITPEQATNLKKQSEERIAYLKKEGQAINGSENEIKILTEGLAVLDEQMGKSIETDKDAKDAKDLLIDSLKKEIETLKTLEETITRMEAITKIGPIAVPSLGGGFPKAPGLSGAPGEPSESEKELANIKAVTEELEKQDLAVGILSSAFDALFTSTEDGFKAMIDSIITSIKRLLAELLARVAILTLLNILTGGGVKFGTILKSAFTSMGIAQGAAGGTVPSGYPHDTFPALLSSGETILTSEQSRNFNRKIDINVTGDIAGRAIALVGRRTESEN